MLKEELDQQWTASAYNEDTDDQLVYYIRENACEIGDKAYIYICEDDELCELEIVHIISRKDNFDLYDELIEDDDVLINGEEEYNADTSAEFITDDNCYLVWFNYPQLPR